MSQMLPCCIQNLQCYLECNINMSEIKMLEIECTNDGLRIGEPLHLHKLYRYSKDKLKIVQTYETLNINTHIILLVIYSCVSVS